MPKRSTHTYESEKDGSALPSVQMHPQYCLSCGACCLVSDTPLDALPRRRSDGAHVLEPGAVVFKLMAKEAAIGPALVRRGEAGVERQWRLACAKCELPVAYRAEPGAPASARVYLIDKGVGLHPALSEEGGVPKCIQPVSTRAVRVAFEVGLGAHRPGIAAITDTEVHAHVRAPHMREGANAELLELCGRVLRVHRHRLQLTRGWSFKSKFVLVAGLARGEVHQRLRAAMDTTDGSYARAHAGRARAAAAGDDVDGERAMPPPPPPVGPPGAPGAGAAAAQRIGAVTSSIRQQWEAGAGEDDGEDDPVGAAKRFKAGWA